MPLDPSRTFSGRIIHRAHPNRHESTRQRPTPTVFVIDADDLLRQRLKPVLEGRDFVVREFANPRSFLENASFGTHGCIVLDIGPDGAMGLDVQRELIRRNCHLPIIFVAEVVHVVSVVDAMKTGAFHFFPKPFDLDALVTAVLQAVEEDLVDHERRNQRDALLARFAMLSPREMEVARLVSVGLLNKQVGAELGIVEKTVAVHRSRVMEKLGAQSVADLVRMIDQIDAHEADSRSYKLSA